MHDSGLLQQALAHLQATKNRWPEVARESGVPYSTITKIFQRVIRDPRVSTVQRLLDHKHADRRSGGDAHKVGAAVNLSESGQPSDPPSGGVDGGGSLSTTEAGAQQPAVA